MAMCMHIAFDASAHSCTRVSECPPGHTQLIISYRIIWYYLFSFSHLFFSFQFVCSNMCKLRIYRTYLDGLNTYYTDEPTNRPIDRSIVTPRIQCASFYSLLLSPHIHTFFNRANLISVVQFRIEFENGSFIKIEPWRPVCVRAGAIACMYIGFSFSFAIVCQIKKAVTEVIGPKIHAKNQNRLDVMTILSPSAHKYVIISTETIFHLADSTANRKWSHWNSQWIDSQDTQIEVVFIIRFSSSFRSPLFRSTY